MIEFFPGLFCKIYRRSRPFFTLVSSFTLGARLAGLVLLLSHSLSTTSLCGVLPLPPRQQLLQPVQHPSLGGPKRLIMAGRLLNTPRFLEKSCVGRYRRGTAIPLSHFLTRIARNRMIGEESILVCEGNQPSLYLRNCIKSRIRLMTLSPT